VTLAEIHTTELGRTPDMLTEPHPVSRWTQWRQDSNRATEIERTVRALVDSADEQPLVVSHGDYHSGNVHFESGHVTGVVDWENMRIAPAQADLCAARAELAVTTGPESADVLLASYTAQRGEIDDVARWDVAQGDRLGRYADHVAAALTSRGLDITTAEVRRRTDAFIDAALERRSATRW
jgi:aminoglycoside phosphotransferase (APT) family kinase protein